MPCLSIVQTPYTSLIIKLLNSGPLGEVAPPPIAEGSTGKRWVQYLSYLVSCGALEDFKANNASETIPIFANYLAVFNTEDSARAILDMRALNALTTSDGVPFSICSAPYFIGVLRSLDFTRFKLRTVHADISNA